MYFVDSVDYCEKEVDQSLQTIVFIYSASVVDFLLLLFLFKPFVNSLQQIRST